MEQEEKDPVRKLLKTLPPLAPPEGFYGRVMAKAREADRSRFSHYFPRVMAVAAVLTVVVWAVKDQWRGSRRDMMTTLNKEISVDAGRMDRQENSKTTEKMRGGPYSAARAPAAAPALKGAAAVQNFVKKEENRPLEAAGRAAPLGSGAKNEGDVKLRSNMNDERLQAKAGVAQYEDQEIPLPLKKQKEARKIAAAAPAPLREASTEQKRDKSPGGVGGKLSNSPLDQASGGAVSKDAPAFSPRHGDNSAVTAFQTVAVQSNADLKKLWARHAPGQQPPMVDFARFTLVAVFSGEKPSAGHAIAITDIQTSAGETVVLYRETAPAPGTMAAAVLTHPFFIRLIPKTTLPIRFQKTSR